MPPAPHAQRGDGPEESAYRLEDFELVRNAEGVWLLILADLPGPLLDNPLADMHAQLQDESLLLVTREGRAQLDNLLAAEYIPALRQDAPANLLLSVVDSEGMRQLTRTIPLRID